MLCQSSITHHKGKRHYRRFCGAIELDTPEVLVLCGDGYQNKDRTVYRNVGLCTHHLRVKIATEKHYK